jgi:hypothetical protein
VKGQGRRAGHRGAKKTRGAAVKGQARHDNQVTAVTREQRGQALADAA